MKKYILFITVLLAALFFAFKPGDNNRPKGVPEENWISLSDDAGIYINMDQSVKKNTPAQHNEVKGKIMFRKGDKWYIFSNAENEKIAPKLIGR
jgi:hypothetical protein